MKKLFTLLSLAAVSMAANAENITWGYYNGTDLEGLPSVGLNAVATYDVAMIVPGDGVLGGSTIEALNFPVNSKTNMADISVWVADLNMNRISETSVEKTALSNGSFNLIQLNDKVVIPSEGVYVGATFKITKANSQADQYPVFFDDTRKDVEGGLMLTVDSEWGDYTSQFGAYVMQVSLSGVNLSEASAQCYPIENAYTTPGKSYEFPVTVSSDGGVAVNNIEYVIDFNGVQETRTADVEIPAGIAQKGSFTVDVTGPAELGEYILKMNITKVNGVANDRADVVAETTVNNVERIAVRRSVVEEFTGTGCGWCPRGLMGMDIMKKTLGDRFIGVGLHQYNSSDPMYNTNYPNLGFAGAPSCKIDRKEELDPFYGSGNNGVGILNDFERLNAVPAPVDVELTAYWQEGTDFEGTDINVDLTANVFALEAGAYTIDFVLTADSIKGTGSSWKQSNYYTQYNANQVDPELQIFAKGGELGKSTFEWAFDDVMISSSYKNSKNQADALGQLEAGQQVTATYTLALPTKKKILDVVKTSLDKVYGIAIVVDSKKKVANAVRVKVVEFNPNGISNVTTDAKATAPAGRYTLDGKQAAEGQKGFTVVRMSDGTVRKELR